MVTVITPSVIKEGIVEEIKPDLARFDKAKEQVNLAVAELNNYASIKSVENRDDALVILKLSKEVDDAIEKKRTELVKPWNDGAKSINSYVKELIKELTPAIDQTKKAVLKFQQDEEERVKKEKRQGRIQQLNDLGLFLNEKTNFYLNDDVMVHAANLDVNDNVWPLTYQKAVNDLKQQAEEKLNKLAEDAEMIDVFGTDDQKSEHQQKVFEATKETAPVINHVPSFGGGGSSVSKLNGTAKVWKFEVTDANQVPREYLEVDETKIRKAVGSGMRSIPGVRIYEDTQLRIR